MSYCSKVHAVFLLRPLPHTPWHDIPAQWSINDWRTVKRQREEKKKWKSSYHSRAHLTRRKKKKPRDLATHMKPSETANTKILTVVTRYERLVICSHAWLHCCCFFCCCHDSAKLDWYLGTSRRWYSNWNLSGVSSENKNKQEQQQNSAYLIFIHRSQFFPKLVFCTFARIAPCCKLSIFFPPCSKDKQINTLQNQLSAGKRVLHEWKQLNDLFLPLAQLKLECETVDVTLTVSHSHGDMRYIYTVYIYT